MAKHYLQSGPLLKKLAGFWVKPWPMALPNIMIHRHGKVPELLSIMDSLSSGMRWGGGGGVVPLGVWLRAIARKEEMWWALQGIGWCYSAGSILGPPPERNVERTMVIVGHCRSL